MLKINNWDDWFANCGSLSPDMKSYEQLAGRYFDMQFSDADKSAAAFQAYHNTGFFENMPKIPGHIFQKSIKPFIKNFAITGIGTMAIMVLIRLFQALKGKIPVQEHMDIPDIFLKSVITGFIFGFISAGYIVLKHLFKMRRLCVKMGRLEDKMRERVKYVPPKYRNSLATDSIYTLYCNHGVTVFEQAIAACDDYLKSNNFVAAYMAIMFDEPYANLNRNEKEEVPDENHEGIPDDPNLPQDIKSKCHIGADNAYEMLDGLIGLDNVKHEIRKMKNRMDFYGTEDKISGNHMVFLGSPGTGKTTVARIITRILYDFGYIKHNRLIEIDGGYMKSPYEGQTTERANAIMRYAMGGVLFMDEAYLLSEGNAGTQAAGVLLKAMEDNRDDFVVIMAGYEDNINRLLSSNEGFASRIRHKIYFNDFTADEMISIFRAKLVNYSRNACYTIDADGLYMLKSHFEKEKRIPGFGNARVVCNAIDAILDIHADRFINGDIPEQSKYVITCEDIGAYIESRRKQMQEDGRNFIANNNLDSSVISLPELKGKTRAGSDNPDADLKSLVGLDMVKKEIMGMKAQFDFYNGNVTNEGNHMVFLGPPGTGKTTVAKIMTGYLYGMGLINENSYLDINGDFLRGMYVGHTGKRTEAVIQYAQGMVLFIDEAYLLNTADGEAASFGQEAVGVLIDAMEKYRKNFIVILAGYEDEMNKFMGMNSGLKSRISLTFHFRAYTSGEMAKMFFGIARRNKFNVPKDTMVKIKDYLDLKKGTPGFGNARFVRQFFEMCRKSHIINYSDGIYGADDKYLITTKDVEDAINN